jgi:hypothetical protein
MESPAGPKGKAGFFLCGGEEKDVDVRLNNWTAPGPLIECPGSDWGNRMMAQRLAFVVSLVGLVACAQGGVEDRRPVAKVFEENDRSPVKSSGWCNRCNFDVFEGHRCGLTAPCTLCKREAGSRHMHEVTWACDRDELVMARQHICNDAKSCPTCRTDGEARLSSLGCERCHRHVPPAKVQGITSYCQTCNQEIGANHIHGKTAFCMSCLREAASGHKCDATRLCMEHAAEHAVDHEHGETEYCMKCHREAGVDHRHGKTEWCSRCRSEKEWPHHNH